MFLLNRLILPFYYDKIRPIKKLDSVQCFFIGNPGEMMVHVIDSIRNAMGSEFTPRKVIEYFRENQMILLVERLEAYLRC